MKRAASLLLASLLLAACGSRDESLPFYLTHVEEMRKLPEEDLLRMKDNILAKAATLPDREANDPMPTGEAVASGEFAPKPARGKAVLYRLPDGALTLRLESFRVTNAPDLHVIAERADGGPPESRELRGNAGNQNYPLPAGDYGKATIQSVLFGETFAEASLARE